MSDSGNRGRFFVDILASWFNICNPPSLPYQIKTHRDKTIPLGSSGNSWDNLYDKCPPLGCRLLDSFCTPIQGSQTPCASLRVCTSLKAELHSTRSQRYTILRTPLTSLGSQLPGLDRWLRWHHSHACVQVPSVSPLPKFVQRAALAQLTVQRPTGR